MSKQTHSKLLALKRRRRMLAEKYFELAAAHRNVLDHADRILAVQTATGKELARLGQEIERLENGKNVRAKTESSR